MDTKHHAQRIWRTTCLVSVIMTFDLRFQLLPRKQHLHLFQKLLTARLATLVIVFRFRKTQLILTTPPLQRNYTGIDELFRASLKKWGEP